MNILHVYAQEHWHDEAFVVGTPKALSALRCAIDHALTRGVGVATSSTADGEAFRIAAVRLESDQVDTLAIPHSDEVMGRARYTAKWPGVLPGVQQALHDHRRERQAYPLSAAHPATGRLIELRATEVEASKTCGNCKWWDAEAAAESNAGAGINDNSFRCLWPTPALPLSSLNPSNVIAIGCTRYDDSGCPCWVVTERPWVVTSESGTRIAKSTLELLVSPQVNVCINATP